MAWTLPPSRADRLHVWASQLAARDFPPICAMTGEPSETWRKFTFARRPPMWAFVGDPFSGLIWAAIRDRASGYLPLTRRSSRTVALATWLPWSLIGGALALWIAGAILGVSAYSTNPLISDAWYVLFLVGSLGLVCGVLGFALKPVKCPRGCVMHEQRDREEVVELRKLHYLFVEAATQMYASRSMPFEADRNLPPAPGSN